MITGHVLTKDDLGRTLIRPIYNGNRWKEGKKALRSFLRTLQAPGAKGILRSGKTEVTLRVTQTREVRL